MEKRIETLVILLIPAIILSIVFETYAQQMFAEIMQFDKSSINKIIENNPNYSIGQIVTFTNWVVALVGMLPAFVLAGWFWSLEKSEKGRPYLWAFGAIFIKYWILILYFSHRYFKDKKESNNETT